MAAGGAEGRLTQGSTGGPPPGFSLTEVLASVALLAVLVSISVPILAETVARERLRAAGLETAVLLREVRQRAVTRGVGFGLRFVRSGQRWAYSLYEDGNGNGIRSAEILSGRDRLVQGPSDPGSRHEGIRFGLPGLAVPQTPPGSGPITNPADPIKFGNTDIIGFSPSGSVSNGTLYLTDGRRVLAVVVYGATGRIRVLRYEPAAGRWWES